MCYRRTGQQSTNEVGVGISVLFCLQFYPRALPAEFMFHLGRTPFNTFKLGRAIITIIILHLCQPFSLLKYIHKYYHI